MNISILQKCLDELEKESPKLDYVRGMLETLILLEPTKPAEVSPQELKAVLETRKIHVAEESTVPNYPQDEARILDASARAKMSLIQKVAHESISS